RHATARLEEHNARRPAWSIVAGAHGKTASVACAASLGETRSLPVHEGELSQQTRTMTFARLVGAPCVRSAQPARGRAGCGWFVGRWLASATCGERVLEGEEVEEVERAIGGQV